MADTILKLFQGVVHQIGGRYIRRYAQSRGTKYYCVNDPELFFFAARQCNLEAEEVVVLGKRSVLIKNVTMKGTGHDRG